MSDFSHSLLTAVIQSTLVVIPAAVVVWLIGRRCAAATATLALASLTVAALLSAAAFAPLPNAWTWSRTAETPADRVESQQPEIADSLAVPAVDLRQLLALLRPSGPADEAAGWTRSAAFGIGIAAIVAISIVRFVLGLMAIHLLRRRSEPINDASLRVIVAQLARELGVRRSVELRSSPVVDSAAACGWRRPAILLAADWQSWESDDLRAVLAHELAHVRRRDYALGVVSRICLTICFHHPLAMWLAGRLRLAQEIAADELAAIVAGGRDCYRRALARMALRQDSAWLGGMAQTFGTNRNSLTRRLTMLVQGSNRPMGRAARAGLIGLVVAIGITVSAVRGTAEPPSAEAPVTASPAFELGYLPENCQGFVAVRPGALFRRPEMKPICEPLTKSLNTVLHALGVPADRSISLADIEQVVGPVELKTMTEDERKKHPGGERHSFMMGINYVRMNRDFDWAGLLKSLPKAMRVVEKEPGLFEAAMPLIGPNPITLRVLDSRTIVGSSLTNEQAAQRRTEIAARFGSRILGSAERSGVVVAMTTTRELWANAIEREPKLADVIQHLGPPARLAVSAPFADTVSGQLTVDWNTPPSNFAKGEELLLHYLAESLRSAAPENSVDKKCHALAGELLSSAKVNRDGNAATADVRSTVRWSDLFTSIVTNGNAKVEVKETGSGQ